MRFDFYLHTIDERALAEAIVKLRKDLMSTIDEVNAKADAAAAALDAANAKSDALIAGLVDVRQALIDLQAAGSATPEQLTELANKLDGMVASAGAQIAEDDAALGAA